MGRQRPVAAAPGVPHALPEPRGDCGVVEREACLPGGCDREPSRARPRIRQRDPHDGCLVVGRSAACPSSSHRDVSLALPRCERRLRRVGAWPAPRTRGVVRLDRPGSVRLGSRAAVAWPRGGAWRAPESARVRGRRRSPRLANQRQREDGLSEDRLGREAHARGGETRPDDMGEPPDHERPARRERGRTVHGEPANAGHRVLAPDDAEVEAYLETALNAPPPERAPSATAGAAMAGQAPPDTVLVLDFGSQYAQLIARRVRELNVYSELVPFDTPMAEIERRRPKALILSGGPASVYDEGAPHPDPAVWSGGIPVLGICYGLQLMAHELGGQVVPATLREYGAASIEVTAGDGLFAGLEPRQPVWMSHGDSILRAPPGFHETARSGSTPFAGLADPQRGLHGTPFHPEVVHPPAGRDILRNFVLGIAGARPTWTPASFIETAVVSIRARVESAGGEGQVLCALSGGVDSAVAATLVHRAVGDRLVCIYVDHGLMRKRESELLSQTFEANLGMRLLMVDARERFLRRLVGVIDPEEKRRIIGDEFIRVFEEEAARISTAAPID